MKTSYAEEQKRKLVKRYFSGESASVICLQTGVPRSTFYTWVKPYKVVGAVLGNEVNAVNYARQKKRIDRLESMVEVLQTVDCSLSSPLQIKLTELEKLYGQYSVHVLCDSLDVSRGTFYNHILRNKKDKNSFRARRENLSKSIREVFEESNQIYGARKIRAILKSRGINTTDEMVTELMQSMNLQSVRSDTRRQHRRLGLLERKTDALKLNFTANAPNQIWVSDVTYFRLFNTTWHICVIIDLYSRKVVSYKMSKRHSTQLITATFKNAYKERQPSSNLTFHSDRGVQYAAYAFRNLLLSLNVAQSFSPSGKPCHNAVMESFFASLKKEELYRVRYRSVRDFEESVGEYMWRYNNKRPHATLRYKTPNAYEQAFFDEQKE